MLLAVPRVRLKHRGDRAFAVAALKFWKTLPLSEPIRSLYTQASLFIQMSPTTGLITAGTMTIRWMCVTYSIQANLMDEGLVLSP